MLAAAGLVGEDMRRFFHHHRQSEFSLCPWLMAHLEQLGSFTYDPTLEYDPDDLGQDDGWVEPDDLNFRNDTTDDKTGPDWTRPSDARGDLPAETLESDAVEPEAEAAATAEEPLLEPPDEPVIPAVAPVIAEAATAACEPPISTGLDYEIILDWKDTSKTYF